MTPEQRRTLRRSQRHYGWGLFIAWIFVWGCIDGAAGVGAALVTFFIPFIAGKYVADALIKQQEVARHQREIQAERARAAAEAAQMAQRAAAAEHADRLTRIKNARKEVIDKFGVVADYLDLLRVTTDADRSMLIVQNIKNALRELVAKYRIHDLAALIRGDEAIQLQLESLLPRLAAAGITSDGGDVVREAWRRALGATGASTGTTGNVQAAGTAAPTLPATEALHHGRA